MRNKLSVLVLLSLLLTATGLTAQQQATQNQPNPTKLQQYVSYLASDALDGRRTGTPGATDAAHYIAGEFSRIGLRPASQKATSGRPSAMMSLYLQRFPFIAGIQMGKGNTMSLAAPGFKKELQVGQDWMPLGFSSNSRLEQTPVAFVGYGITATELNHNDYANNRASGKIALALAGTPDGDNPHGQFGAYEGARWKAIAARNAGARALIIVSREANLKADRMAQLVYDNSAGDAGLPVVVVSQEVVGGKAAFDNLEAGAKKGVNSFDEQGSTASLTTDLVRSEVAAYNVIGILEGSDPVLRNETIVIGAHYDHLGRGGEGSLAQHPGEIHHGADDNASGVAGVLELARIFATQRPKPKRTMVFVAFSGEEEGLLGSNYYVNHPVKPLAGTVAMINMDMIGRMRERKLIVGGVGTAKEWRELVETGNALQSTSVAATNKNAIGIGLPVVISANGRPIVAADSSKTFELTLQEDGYGPSDHSSFYAKQIPVLFFWTGNHADYHKPSDTFDKINYDDEARILSLVARIVRDVDRSDKKLSYTVAKSDAQMGRATGFRVYLGTIPNYADTGDGLLLDGVRDDSPAAKAGLKAGDRVVKIGDHAVHNVYDYTYALGELKAGEEYMVEILRGTEKLTLKLTPAKR
jgi:Zn-dependent M28 family amino/carboxypeptidase